MHRWIAIGVASAAVACGGDHGATPAPARDAAARISEAPIDAAVALAIDVPAPATGAVLLPARPPAAMVTIAGDGSIAVGPTGGSWSRVASGAAAADARPVASVAQVPRAVLEVVVGEGGREGEVAKGMIAALDADIDAAPSPYGTLGRSSEDADISMTYLAPVSTLPAPTPLIVAARAAPAQVVSNVLDATGGMLAIADRGGLAVAPLGAPFANPGYGGVDVDEDTPSVDLMLGPGPLALADPQPHLVAPDQLAAAIAAQRGGADAGVTATTDVLVTQEADADQLIAALITLEAKVGGTIGVGTAPWHFPRFGMDGNVDLGPIGIGGHPPVTLDFAPVVTADAGYADRVRFSLHRATARLASCSDAHGAIAIAFDVDGAGNVGKVHAGTSSCVAAVLASIVMPSPPHGKAHVTSTITYP